MLLPLSSSGLRLRLPVPGALRAMQHEAAEDRACSGPEACQPELAGCRRRCAHSRSALCFRTAETRADSAAAVRTGLPQQPRHRAAPCGLSAARAALLAFVLLAAWLPCAEPATRIVIRAKVSPPCCECGSRAPHGPAGCKRKCLKDTAPLQLSVFNSVHSRAAQRWASCAARENLITCGAPAQTEHGPEQVELPPEPALGTAPPSSRSLGARVWQRQPSRLQSLWQVATAKGCSSTCSSFPSVRKN